jgi:hypothetical protein
MVVFGVVFKCLAIVGRAGLRLHPSLRHGRLGVPAPQLVRTGIS